MNTDTHMDPTPNNSILTWQYTYRCIIISTRNAQLKLHILIANPESPPQKSHQHPKSPMQSSSLNLLGATKKYHECYTSLKKQVQTMIDTLEGEDQLI